MRSDEAWALASPFFGIAGWFVAETMARVYRKRFQPRDAAEYIDRIEEPAMRLLRAGFHYAECKEALADVISTCPEHFEEPIMDADVLARQIMAAVQSQAERRGGFYRPGREAPPVRLAWHIRARAWLRRVRTSDGALLDVVVPRDVLLPPERPILTTAPEPTAPSTATVPPKVARGSGVTWINVGGELVADHGP